jgi:NAD(P)H dehydrogenase (quinone)
LGRLVIDELLKTTEAKNIIAAVRTPTKAQGLIDRGIQVREADYSRPETLATAFKGAAKLLLISGTDLGKREVQHKAAIDAAKSAGIKFVAYTSILHCDTSPLLLAVEHLATERYLQSSGLNYSLLRNGWYYENQTAAIPQAIKNGALIGASGDGRFAAASRSDYAAAAAAVLTGEGHEDSVLELGGDQPYTRAELAAEVTELVIDSLVRTRSSQTLPEEYISDDDIAHEILRIVTEENEHQIALIGKGPGDAEVEFVPVRSQVSENNMKRLFGSFKARGYGQRRVGGARSGGRLMKDVSTGLLGTPQFDGNSGIGGGIGALI